MDDITFFFGMLGTFAVGLFLWSRRRGDDLLKSWARARGLELVSQERRWLDKGPFLWSGGGQTVFHVTVREPSGRVRRAYVRCGNRFSGMFGDEVEERWEDMV